MRELHLFAGAGGGILAGMLLGHTPVCAVEIDDYCRRVLRARQADGWLPAEMEIHDDVTTFDGTAWRGRVDLVAGGFPCQDLSLAGKGAGLDGKRSGLWFEMLRVICEVRPSYVFVENVPAITSRGLDRVLGSLAEAGWDAEWLCLPASAVGAAHRRDRWWCLARNTNGTGAKPAKPGVRQGAVTDPVRVSEAVSDSSSVQLVCELGGNTAELPDSSSGQDHGRGRAELASAPQAGQGGDSAAVVGSAHDPDAHGGRREVERLAEHGNEFCESRRVSDGLRAGRRGHGPDVADADSGRREQRNEDERRVSESQPCCAADAVADSFDKPSPMRGYGALGAEGMAVGIGESRGSERDSGSGCPRRAGDGACDAADSDYAGREQQRGAKPTRAQRAAAQCSGGREAQRGLGRVADGLAGWLDLSAAGFWNRDWETEPRLTQGQADRVARLRAIGNGQVPQCAAAAFIELWRRMHA